MARFVAQIRRRWPCVRILLRADSGFNAPPATALVPVRWFGVRERVLQGSGLSEASDPVPLTDVRAVGGGLSKSRGLWRESDRGPLLY